ncbi:MAG TPA: hypothetical protein VEY30_05730 [Myxococcaceae bacterium]|nr:hypothetical protein [Myxococcaceae bacterium]
MPLNISSCRSLRRPTVGYTLILLLAACGSDITNIDGDAELSALTPSERTELCRDSLAYFRKNVSEEDLKELSCGITGSISYAFAKAFGQDGVAACQTSFQTCQSKPPESDSEEPDDSTAEDEDGCSVSTSCTDVTVDDYTTCLRETTKLLRGYTFSCEALPSKDSESGVSTSPVLDAPSCAKIRAACNTPSPN